MRIIIRPTSDGYLLKSEGNATIDCNGKVFNLTKRDTFQVHIKSNADVLAEAYEEGYAAGLKRSDGDRHHVTLDHESSFPPVTPEEDEAWDRLGDSTTAAVAHANWPGGMP